MPSARVLLTVTFTLAVGIVIALLPTSFQAARADHVFPEDSACADREYSWASTESAPSAPPGDGSADETPDAVGDSVFARNYSFRPGRPSQIVSSGLIHNQSDSVIEIRGFRVEFLSATGEVVGESMCRVIMGGEQCGVGGSNLKRPGVIAVTADTLLGAPESADRDTARIYWSYCRALGSSD